MAESRKPLLGASRTYLLPIKKIHTHVHLDDLDEKNGKLFSDAEIHTIKTDERWQQNGRYKKSQTGYRYPLVVQNKKYFAVYRGKKSNRQLGEGSYGYVKLAQDLDTGEFYALKVQKLTGKEERVKNEMKNLKMLELSPLDADGNAIAYDWESSGGANTSEAIVMRHFLMNLVHGESLDRLIARTNPLPLVVYLKLAIKLLQQAETLFLKHNMLHNDIKLENIIVDSDLSVSLVDYAFSSRPSKDGRHIDKFVGCPSYMAPEIIQQRIDAEPSIIFSALGIFNKTISGFDEVIIRMLRLGMVSVSPAIMEQLANQFPRHAKHKAFEKLHCEMAMRWRQTGVTSGQPVDLPIPTANIKVEYTEKTQIYALGVVLAKLFGFEDLLKVDADIMLNTISDHIMLTDPVIKVKLRVLIESMLEINPTERLTHQLAIQQLEVILASLSPADRQISAAIISATDLYDNVLNAGLAKEIVSELIQKLARYHAVYLLCDFSSADFDLIYLQQYLRSRGVRVQNHFICASPNTNDSSHYLAEIAAANRDNIYEIQHVVSKDLLLQIPGKEGVVGRDSSVSSIGLFAQPHAPVFNPNKVKSQWFTCCII